MPDPGELRDLGRSPERIAMYLHGRGWNPVGVAGDEILWALDDGGRRWEIVLPLSPDRSDLARRLGEVFAVLGAVQNRRPAEILRDVRSAGSDVLKIRTLPRTRSGTAPIDDALGLIAASKDLLLAAATSIDAPRAVLGSRKPARATEFVREVRLATEPGSFVVALETTVPPDWAVAEVLALAGSLVESGGQVESDGLFVLPVSPFPRAVTTRTIDAASAAVSLAARIVDGEADVAAFDDLVSRGVSANFLEALAGIGGGEGALERNTGVDLTVRWAYSRTPPLGRPATIAFPSNVFPVFATAASSLRARSPEPDVTLVGPIIRLQRDNRTGDTVTMVATVGQGRSRRSRQIRLVLNDEHHDLAHAAYGERRIVEVRGDLQSGPVLTMNPVRSFVVR
ncbi:conserved hypothetical protein [Frankia sp. AiPs1]|uniref:hypothetical protein n=1 Tax=Frankia sp. AiPa1 TaxID=573492 RepID=UPI00202B35AB|nr:hypothetical protein [Frankia sp. AiPa1]MCL9762635.1 hypothetical protein [Frankia sp. AiPa1]